MEGVHLLSVATVDHPSLTNIQQGRQDDCMIQLEFGLQVDTSLFPHTDVYTVEGHIFTCNSVSDLFINSDCP